ncbi:MAG: ankyrin repeat domain-containing protein, partial [Candidatus Thiodiazotropha endolucinida]|nr:ankyrin repeat domain-containing protein [Candidatus Thiodiazotropha taylori]MCW4329810.1 ankyrin repeat domain-containing protein [Candidatus Thiodiazotropha endolucinida]
LVNELIQNEQHIDRESDNGNTALMLAARSGSVYTVDILLRYGPDLNHYNHAGNSALMLAAEQGNMEVVKRLLEVKADAHHLNLRRENAFDIARSNGHDKVADYIDKNKGSGGLLDFMR